MAFALTEPRIIQARARSHIINTYVKSAICIAQGRPDPAYPKRMKLATVPTDWALQHTSELRDWNARMLRFADEYGLEIDERTMRVPARIDIVTHVTMPSATVADNLVRERWPQDAGRLPELSARLVRIRDHFGQDALDRVCELGAYRVDKETATDFDLICQAADYMADHDVSGMTPRQVPLPGFSAKWLNKTRLSTVCAILGRDIALASRPAQIDFAYLDPDHAAAGLRHFDSYTEGDSAQPAYAPNVIIIVENVDNMRCYPQTVPGGICVFGHGYTAVSTLVKTPWIRDCQRVVYWGDIDQDGYRILDAIRASGIEAESLHMGCATYRDYERYGTCLDKSSRNMPRLSKAECEHVADQMPHLTADERAALVKCLRTGTVRRIEQERIPF